VVQLAERQPSMNVFRPLARVSGVLIRGSWGSAALHPRLYAFVRSADWPDRNYEITRNSITKKHDGAVDESGMLLPARTERIGMVLASRIRESFRLK